MTPQLLVSLVVSFDHDILDLHKVTKENNNDTTKKKHHDD
jgi:hypothetical protein